MKIKIIFCFCLGVFLSSCNQNTEFDSEEWKRNGGIRITLEKRMNMVDDLMDKEILLQKSESEVEEIIGHSSNPHNMDNRTTKYYAVQEIYGWADIDPKELIYLKVQYNDKGLVESVNLYSTE
ncbi:MAG: hypothetical protein COA32_10290 [Fluviicola sp.]|nr:MAG: hypothetical protein COA32_10290 [Fluviicola sp.]